MTLRNLTGGPRWDEATGWPSASRQYAPPKPGNGLGGDPCPCERPHGMLYRDPACDAATARAELVRRTAIATSAERATWLERPQDVAAREGRRLSAAIERAARQVAAFGDAVRHAMRQAAGEPAE